MITKTKFFVKRNSKRTPEKMALNIHAKIWIGWVSIWLSGGATFYFLQKRVDAQRKQRMKMRRLKRKEKLRQEQEKQLAASDSSLPEMEQT